MADREKSDAVKEFEKEAGPAVGEMPPNVDTGPQDVHAGDVDALILAPGGQLSFAVGGKQPTTSSLRLVGGKIEVQGQYEKGERLVLRIECEVREVAFRNQTDPKTAQVIGCERKHAAAITGIDVLDGPW